MADFMYACICFARVGSPSAAYACRSARSSASPSRTGPVAFGRKGTGYSSSSFILFFAAFAIFDLPAASASSSSAPTFFSSNCGFSAKCTPT